jgi:hypothetical protein
MIENLHLILVLHQKLDSLNGGSGGLGDGSGDTSHEEVGHEGTEVLGLGWVGHDAELLVLEQTKTRGAKLLKHQAAGFEPETSRKRVLAAVSLLHCPSC